MSRIFHPLLYIWYSASRRELIRQAHFLKIENQEMRNRLPEVIRTTPEERRALVKAARGLSRETLRELVTIVSPATLIGWMNAEDTPKSKKKRPTRKPGRPRTPEDVRALVIRIAQETGIAESTLSKFMAGERGFSLASLDRLADYLGLHLAADPKRRKWIMAHLFKPTIVRYRTADGKAVPKGTPGARKVRERTEKWYGGYRDATDVWQRVPLCADKEAAKTAYSATVSVVDKGVQKGVLHKNTASRYKARLSARVNAVAAK